jgi:outer membrane protein assembly factor BamD (BamD/ComL family)
LRELWINDQLAQADRAYQGGDFAGAVRSLRRIMERYPETQDAQSAQQMIEQINEIAEGLIQ